MPKFVQEIIENYFWSEASYCEAMLNETSFEIPDFPSGSEEEFWHKSEDEIELDGHVW